MSDVEDESAPARAAEEKKEDGETHPTTPRDETDDDDGDRKPTLESISMGVPVAADEGRRDSTFQDERPEDDFDDAGVVPGKLRCKSLGLTQTLALLRKNFLTKYRTPLPTFFELFSPVLMMLILVAAYTLSEIRNRDARIYSDIELDLPGPWLRLVEQGLELVELGDGAVRGRRTSAAKVSGRTTSDVAGGNATAGFRLGLLGEMGTTHDVLDAANVGGGPPEFLLERGGASRGNPDASTTAAEAAALRVKRILRSLQVGGPDPDPEEDQVDNEEDPAIGFGTSGSALDLFNDARGQLNQILEGPLFVPTFSQYVAVSSALSSLIDTDDLNIIITDSSYGREWGNLLTLGTLHVMPNDGIAQEFVEYLRETHPVAAETVKIRFHNNEKDALKFIDDNLSERTWALLDLRTGTTVSSGKTASENDADELLTTDNDFMYKIRMNYTTLPNTNRITNFVSVGLNRRYQRYYLSGYMTMQKTLNEFAFWRTSMEEDEDANGMCESIREGGHAVWSMPMPTARFSQNTFYQAVGYLLGLTLAMAFLYPTSRLIKSMVEEKETRMKETLLILGVRQWAHWLSWTIMSLIIFFCISVMVTLTLTSNVLGHSSKSYIFAYIFLFSTATIGFSFFVAAFFSRAKLSAIVGPIALFATLLPRWIFFGTNRYEATGGKMLASLLPCTAFAFGADIIADYEYSEQGIQRYNVNEGEYSFNTSLGFLFVDTILYFVLGWYLERVLPRQYGVAEKWYFLCTPKYWREMCGCWCRGRSKRNAGFEVEDLGHVEMYENQGNSQNFEPVSDLTPQVQICNLVKRYNKKPDVPPAVNNLNLMMYESQITCLLGHNGAGKTTTISVLTGLFPPTSGDCTIYGNSIVNDMMEARHAMGLCPQHNVLFDKLTVLEHLSLFERIKGMDSTRESVAERAKEVGLGDYLGTTSCALSGGNKRKLSVAISLCGNPKFLLLDEPTSGMDPYSRRATWELLRRKRRGRVMLLTTHFMDEAELLADRIAVLKGGKLQCVGSGLFLKDRFGLGYNLTVVLDADKQTERNESFVENSNVAPSIDLGSDVSDVNGNDLATDGADAETGSHCDATQSKLDSDSPAAAIATFLQTYIPSTKLVRYSARELTYRFPQGTEDSFPAMFDELENARDTLCIGAYGISNTTLEEVFLKLAEEEEEDNNDEEEDQEDVNDGEDKGADRSMLASAHTAVTLEDTLRASTETDQISNASEPTTSETKMIPKQPPTQRRSPGQADYEMDSFLSACSQTKLLLHKRYLVQKRDIKGFFFMIILPVILIGAVLLVLMVDVPLAGPGINMGMKLYESGPNGESGSGTDVLVADGLNETIVDGLVEEMSRDFREDYPNANIKSALQSKRNASGTFTSHNLSTYLLDTYNDRTHNLRFGAFVFGDVVDVDLKMNWEEIRSFLQAATDDPVGTNILVALLDSATEEGDLRLTFSVKELGEFIVQNSNLTYASEFNATLLREQTSAALDTILSSSEATANNTEEVDNWIANIQNATNLVADDILFLSETTVNPNATSAAEVVTTFFSTLFELLTDSDGNISGEIEFNSSAVEEATDTLVEGALDALGISDGANTTTITDDLINIINAVVDDGDGPQIAAVASLVVLDTLVAQVIEDSTTDGTITLRGILEILSVLGGGTREDLDGLLIIEASGISFEPATDSVIISNPTIRTADGVPLFTAESTTLPADVVSGALISTLPTGRSDIQFNFTTDASILHNSSSPHAIGAFNQAYMQFRYKQCTSTPTAQLLSINHPLPLTTQQNIEIRTILSIFASLFLLIPYCYIPAAFIVFLVKERVSKSKHLQLVSGVNMSSYWISTYLWDLLLFSMLTTGVMIVFLIYGSETAQVFVGTVDSFFATAALTFGYGMSALPFAYLLSLMFENHSTAQISVMGIFFVTGFVAVNGYFIMDSIEETKHIAKALRPLFRLWPAYNVGDGLLSLSSSFFEREILDRPKYPFDWDVCGVSLALLYGLSAPYFILLLLLEYSNDGGSGGFLGRGLRWSRGWCSNMMLRWHGVRKEPDGSLLLDDGLDDNHGDDDPDVAKEQSYVTEHREELKHLDKVSVLLVDLWKIYSPSTGVLGSLLRGCKCVISKCFGCLCRRCRKSPKPESDDHKSYLPKRAVRGLTTAITEGETFGLLGVNGAGKTTTLGVLTGDVTPTGGDAYVAGYDVTGRTPGGVAMARKRIGFCPQVDPLLDLMTGRETLVMFGKLRGIPKQYLNTAVDELLEDITLTPHADKVAQSYSGGNKRKLSLGVALIGNPKVLFIDEASSGMDPAARRKMWELIAEVSKNRSVVLTTHVMEEAEALCTRVGIMTAGKMRCLGSVQHLKTNFLDGYTIDVHCKAGTPDDVIEMVSREILETVLPGSLLQERHGRFMRFDVSKLSTGRDDLALGNTFRRLQTLKMDDQYMIENYSISQCSLEQVFISLVQSGQKQKNQISSDEELA